MYIIISEIYLTSKTLITVPFSEAVATLVPVELKAIAANGLSCAGIIVLACYIDMKKLCKCPVLIHQSFFINSDLVKYIQDGLRQIFALLQSCSSLDKLNNNCHYLAKGYKGL